MIPDVRTQIAALQQKERAEAEEQQRQAQTILEQQEEYAQFKNWLKTEAAAYQDEEKLKIFFVFNHLIGGVFPRQRELLALIDHIDDPRCKEQVKQRLSLLNKASRTAFFT